MFSGLERQRAAFSRQKSVAWAWIKARGIVDSRPTPKSSMLTKSVLSKRDNLHFSKSGNWRDSLAAITYRNLARQLCEQFYDLSIFYAWRSRTPEAVEMSRMLSPALPSYCRNSEKVFSAGLASERGQTARILMSVLPTHGDQRGAVLIPLRRKAA
jgi:hypothetical protein